MARVLVAGHVNLDVTLLVDRLPAADEEAAIQERVRSGGGSAANVATGLARLGVDARLLGSVGDDEPGRRVRERLGEHGVDVDPVVEAPGETSTKYLLVADEDVAMLGNDGVNEAVAPADLAPGTVADVEHVHLTGQRADTAERLARLAVDAGCSVSLDPGRRAGDRALDGVADRADVVFGTDREIAALYGDDPTAAAGSERLVVATSGAGGARCFLGDETRAHPGFDVDVADTSGAGDAFVAGFLSIWLAADDLDEALAFGNACGAIASQRVGARTALDPDAVASFRDGSP
ncbi:sugar kinase, ribokinase [Salinarchaeum sp. Harcht-Bsk1]|uniref:carbohydrate kinase family protein n=1 Tax=Salinarchaeum sp. Harcht-Bsk1 TaxID=1333523 RepID=UPI0003423D43|nr:carbohydrate kinase family protein [Salinarchaeum sp. Harcht-Bsk1]AGN00456.1 sugar kinase, ribokinase [Salinarchaeum sp. Harcht-Bsk1]